MRRQLLSRGLSWLIGALATRQHGVVARRQLLALGAHPRAIDRRIKAGLLIPVHRGVYLVGHATLTPRARDLAAILACAESATFDPTIMVVAYEPELTGAVLSDRSATAFWEMLPYPAHADVCVTVRNRTVPRHPGISARSTSHLARRDFVIRDRIPVSTPPRAILEIAATVSPASLERAIAEGYARRLLTERQLRDQVERNPGRRGTGALRSLLDRLIDPAFTRSRAERILLGLIRDAGLPEPLVNVSVNGLEVDFHWPAHRVVVEVDGWAFHSDPGSFVRDRARTNALLLSGYVVLRYTWRQLREHPDGVVSEIREALRQGSRRADAGRTRG